MATVDAVGRPDAVVAVVPVVEPGLQLRHQGGEPAARHAGASLVMVLAALMPALADADVLVQLSLSKQNRAPTMRESRKEISTVRTEPTPTTVR